MRLWSCWSQLLLSCAKNQNKAAGTEIAEMGDERQRRLVLGAVISLFPGACLVRALISFDECTTLLTQFKLGFVICNQES